MEIEFKWERLNGMKAQWTYRTKVIGGWVLMLEAGHMLFISDPAHKWIISESK